MVEYYLQPTEALPYPTVKGRLATIAQHENDHREFNEFPQDRMKIGADGRSAIVRLNPGEVLFLISLDIRDIDGEPTLKSGIGKLSIKSQSGAVVYEGDQVFQQFVPSHSALFPNAPYLYTLTYNQ